MTCAAVTGASTDGYFEWQREDVLRLVPNDVQRVLSVGCGAGATEAVLAERGVDVVGIEPNTTAASAARERGLQVICSDAVGAEANLAERTFDCLIYADVLEHIVDPVAVLRMHVRRLEPGGLVVISVPNLRHYTVFRDLFLRGRIVYRDAGICDRTHVRMTTQGMVVAWLAEVGVTVVRREYRMSRRRERIVATASLGLLREFTARQVLVVGRKATERGDAAACLGKTREPQQAEVTPEVAAQVEVESV